MTRVDKPFDDSVEARRLRRERREARRAKQREQNVHRAAKMHAARVAYEIEHPTTAAREVAPPADETSKLVARVGCSGWFYWHWRECFYPEGSPTNAWFEYYASQFNTVELNAPFYSWPTVGTVETWRRQPGRRKFTYTVKVCELITHV